MPAKYSPPVSKAEMNARIDDLIALHHGQETLEHIAAKWTARKGSDVATTYVATCYGLTKDRLPALQSQVATSTWCGIVWGG